MIGGRDMLKKKLLRDMRASVMQFFALVVLCVLSTFLFSGIDGIARMIRTTNSTYFESGNLADLWVTLPEMDRAALARLRETDGVESVQARFTLDMQTKLPGEPTLCVLAVDGPMDTNIPVITEGSALDPTDRRGCLMQHGFAETHGICVGDRITVQYADVEYTLIVRGIAFSPEFISVSDGVAADTTKYGCILANACAFEPLPLTQAAVCLSDNADAQAVRASIAAALDQAFIIDRSAHKSTAATVSLGDIFAALAIVFPLAAYAVAALIVMTTLTRMIDNQRLQLGTLKSLGFSSGQIERHYLSYAIFPSLVGSVLGTLIGHSTLPYAVWDMVLGEYEYPFRLEPPISLPAWGITLLIICMSTAICMIAYRKSARECTAALLRPKPPQDGKRLLLERITPLWRSLSFNGKMICRNLLRSKLRTLMSCVGILCCNALLIASLGLQDSISETVYHHYQGTLGYQYRANLNEKADDAESYERRLDAQTVECIMEKSATATLRGSQRTIPVTVVREDQTLLRLGPDETHVRILPGMLAVSERFAEAMDAAVGDVVTLQLPADDEPVSVEIGQIVVNNFSLGVYMTADTWLSLRKGDFVPTAIQLAAPSDSCLALLKDMDEVDSIDHTAEQAEQALIALNMLSAIFYLLMVIALALAFVICYNMGLINFSERTREYATLKVLGYHQKEIRRLILRENAIIAAVSILLSVQPGIMLTKVILKIAETETARYVNHTKPSSIIVSCVITWAFSALIQRLLAAKVKRIDMVEALKSVE